MLMHGIKIMQDCIYLNSKNGASLTMQITKSSLTYDHEYFSNKMNGDLQFKSDATGQDNQKLSWIRMHFI